jgi:hypothetical protein
MVMTHKCETCDWGANEFDDQFRKTWIEMAVCPFEIICFVACS